MVILVSGFTKAGQAKTGFDAGRVSFSVKCNGLMLGYQIQSLFVLPGETIKFNVFDANWKRTYTFTCQDGKTQENSDREWQWTAPAQSGLYQAVLAQSGSDNEIRLNLFVLVPFDKIENGYLNGYRIGEYPDQKRGEKLTPPRGFVEVTEENRQMNLTPHFTLQQFVSRQKSDYPKYVVIDERLLIKLETLISRLNLEGYPCRTLIISSGYRTPYYNKRLGNTPYSLHLWGMAADLLVDNDYDGLMDDLNKDGDYNLQDSNVLKGVIKEIENEIRHSNKIGGIGAYKETDHHGPFIHMDVRGDHAEW